MNPFQPAGYFRKQIGPAFWLLGLLTCYAAGEPKWDSFITVNNGNAFTDNELASMLEVSATTVANWRTRLRAAGLLTWDSARNGGRVFQVRSVTKILGAPNGMLLSDSPVTSGEYVN